MQIGTRTVFFVVLLMALLAASYMFMFKPQNQQIEQARADIRTKQDKLAALERATAEVRDLPKEIEKLRKAITFFESKLPEEKEMDKILREVWQTAEKNGLNVKSVRNLKVVPGDEYNEQPIKMVIVGPFTGFYNFLRAVEQLPRITRIPEMTLEKDTKTEGVMQADLVLTIFFDNGRSGQKPGSVAQAP